MAVNQLPVQSSKSSRNPTLVPNMDKSVANGSTVDHENPGTFLANNPRVAANATVTVGGTVTTGDSIGLNISGGTLSTPVGLAYTTVGGDTVTTIAEKLANLINSNTALNSAQLYASVSGAVVTLNWPGPVGNFALVTGAVNPATVTLTITGTGSNADQLSIVVAGQNFNGGNPYQLTGFIQGTGASASSVAGSMKNLINADAVMSAASITATNSGAVISISVPAAVEPLTISFSAAPVGEAITVGGSIVNGDSGILTITNAALPSGSLQLTIPVVTADSTTTVAAKIVAAVLASQPLAAIGLTATSSGPIVGMNWTGNTGTISFSRTNGSNITFTLTAGTVETVTVGGSVVNGDTLIVTISNAMLSGGSVALSIPIVTLDSTTTVATKLKNAINGSLPLNSIGVFASSAAAVVSIGWINSVGAVTFAKTNGSSITGTLGGGPTEGGIVGGPVTEVLGIGSGTTSVVAASETCTIGETTPTASDTLSLIFTNAGVPGLPVTVTYTLVSTDSATVIAAGLAAAINANAVLAAANITASSAAAIITVHQPGLLGNSTVITHSVGGGNTGTYTFTFGNGGDLSGGLGVGANALTGGSGPILVTNNFQFSPPGSGQSYLFLYGQPYALGYDVLSQMVTQKRAII